MTATWWITMMLSMALLLYLVYGMGKSKGRSEERAKRPKPPQPVCPCSHVWGEHKEGGQCHGQVRRPYYSSIGTRNGHQWVACKCTKYHGPIPIMEDYFHPGFTTLPEIEK